MDKETANAIAITSLREEIEKKKKQKGVILKFTPYVIYQHGDIKDQEQLVVRIQLEGYYCYNIEMEEGKHISSKTHHLGFSAKNENFAYNEIEKIFTITGCSKKMGPYKVQFLIDGNI